MLANQPIKFADHCCSLLMQTLWTLSGLISFSFFFLFFFKAKFIYTHENMDNQNHCRSIKQAKHIVNAHKHNWLNSFCNNGYVYIKQHENNNKNLSCSLSFLWLSNRGEVFVCLFVCSLTPHFSKGNKSLMTVCLQWKADKKQRGGWVWQKEKEDKKECRNTRHIWSLDDILVKCQH